MILIILILIEENGKNCQILPKNSSRGRFLAVSAFRRFGGLTEISAELFRPILTEISAEISVSVVHYWQHWQLITYRHQSTGSLTKSISLDSEFAGVTCSTIDVTVRAVIHSGRIQMTIAHWASKATFMPILKEMGHLLSVASFFRRQNLNFCENYVALKSVLQFSFWISL